MVQVFVTVGTTRFDSLINEVLSDGICNLLKKNGFSKVVMQIGESSIQKKIPEIEDFDISLYKYKNSIAEDIKDSSLIITHAGAGSILESLGANKTIVAVINEDLMGNHQTELAEELAKEKYVVCSTCRNLRASLEKLHSAEIRHYIPGDASKFWKIIDESFGFS